MAHSFKALYQQSVGALCLAFMGPIYDSKNTWWQQFTAWYQGGERRWTRAWFLLPKDASNNLTFSHQTPPLKGSTTSYWYSWPELGFHHVACGGHFKFQTRQQPPLLPGLWTISDWAFFIADIFHSPKALTITSQELSMNHFIFPTAITIQDGWHSMNIHCSAVVCGDGNVPRHFPGAIRDVVRNCPSLYNS